MHFSLLVLISLLSCVRCIEPDSYEDEEHHPADQRSYEELCALIQYHGALAPKLFNKGEKEEALNQLELASVAFMHAVEANDEEPQAYLDYAIVLTNAQRFESAIELFEEAMERSPPEYHSLIAKRITHARLGYYSTERDKHNNAGELIAAAGYAELQYGLTNHPSFLFDWGMLLVQISEVIPQLWDRAIGLLNLAQEKTFAVYAIERRLEARSKNQQCSLVREWKDANGNDLLLELPVLARSDPDYGVYASGIHEYSDEVGAYHQEGPSSIIVSLKDVEIHGSGILLQKNPCRLFLGSASSFVNLVENFQSPRKASDKATPLPSANKDALPVKTIEHAFSVLQYHGNTYYHWMMEALGRLVVLLPLINSHPNSPIIMPAGFKKQPFVLATLRTYFPTIPMDRFVEYSTSSTHLWHVTNLIVADWIPSKIELPLYPPVAEFVNHALAEQPDENREETEVEECTAGGNQCAEKKVDRSNERRIVPLHCVATKRILGLISQHIAAHHKNENSDGKETEELIIYLTRRNMKRSLDRDTEDSLTRKLHELVAKVNANENQKKLSLLVLGPEDMGDMQKIRRLFQKARIVIGVHGGAFSNILFCRPKTNIVELGFRTPASLHYHHASLALGMSIERLLSLRVSDNLGLNYKKFLLAPTERGIINEVLHLSVPGEGEALSDSGDSEEAKLLVYDSGSSVDEIVSYLDKLLGTYRES